MQRYLAAKAAARWADIKNINKYFKLAALL